MSQTLDQLYQSLKEQLLPVTTSAGQASLEAVLLLEGTLGIEAAAIYSDGKRLIPDEKSRPLDLLLKERLERRIPVQYLLHKAWFYGLSFYVNPSVLIPRPETELLIEKVLAKIQPGQSVLDVGTGPGTIALTLAHHVQAKKIASIRITGVDVSTEALKVARFNQRLLKTDVEWLPSGDLLAPAGTRRFDIIVSNPPYIDPGLHDTLAPEVLWHEPNQALFPPNGDAYYFYKRLTAECPNNLNPKGFLLVEVGAGMADEVQTLFKRSGFQHIEQCNDLAGIPRVVCGQMP